MRVRDKVAIVTGGARGLGFAIAQALAAEGATVVIADIAGEDAAAVSIGAGAVPYHADVSRWDHVESLVGYAVEKFGRLDVMCANAGVEGDLAPSGELSQEAFDRVINVNLTGAWLCQRHAIPAMLLSGGGSIIHIASVAGKVAVPGTSPYGAAKAGQMQLARIAAHEYGAAGIRVNSICPGAIETPMLNQLPAKMQQQIRTFAGSKTAIPHLGDVADVAHAAVYLASGRIVVRHRDRSHDRRRVGRGVARDSSHPPPTHPSAAERRCAAAAWTSSQMARLDTLFSVVLASREGHELPSRRADLATAGHCVCESVRAVLF